jgi:hypothetical protein
MNDPVAYSAGRTQGSSDAVNMTSSPTPPEYEGNPDYAAGYDEGMATASGPASEPAPTDPAAVHAAGYAQGLEDRANQSSSPVPPEDEDSKEYAQSYEYAQGDAAAADPAAYYAGEQAGRSDTIHKRSSVTPPEYEGNEAYAKGYADGLAAPPYRGDVEAEQKEEEDAATPKLNFDENVRSSLPDDAPVYGPDNPRPPSMSPAMPGDYPPPPPEGEDPEMPHGEYGPEKAGQTWDPKTHSWRWDWEIREEELKTGQGEEGEASAD